MMNMNHELIKQQAEDAPLHKWHSQTIIDLCNEIDRLRKIVSQKQARDEAEYSQGILG